jgi:hypothetical protein
MSAAASGRTSAVRLIIRFPHGSLKARNGAIRIKGAPNVTRDSKAPAAHSENPSNACVRALPSVCRERKAKKIAPSDKVRVSQTRTRLRTRCRASYARAMKAGTNAGPCAPGRQRQTGRWRQPKILKFAVISRVPLGKGNLAGYGATLGTAQNTCARDRSRSSLHARSPLHRHPRPRAKSVPPANRRRHRALL